MTIPDEGALWYHAMILIGRVDMKTFADRFRRWYDYERDCNAKCVSMLQSVPEDRRSDPSFQKAVDKLVHLVKARQRWLYRLGHWPEIAGLFPQGTSLTEVPSMLAEIETGWVNYLAKLDDESLNKEVEWVAADNKRYRWELEGILTQTFGHAWYHRGQIAHIVANLGGKAVDTDYIFWSKLTPLE
jgi:uncharacterized damage-inducible protein DinB